MPREVGQSAEYAAKTGAPVLTPSTEGRGLVSAAGVPTGTLPSLLTAGDVSLRSALLLNLQRRAGNAAVGPLISPLRRGPAVVQRACTCGTCGSCGGEEGDEPLATSPITVSRQGPAPPAPAICTLAGGSPLEQVLDGFKQGTPECLSEAWGLLNLQAMFGLLPLLEALKQRGKWAEITAGAGPRGGPRMQVAVQAVDLKTKGTPITGEELKDLIDRMGPMNPDQRADILRYLGKYVKITVDGLDLDISYCKGKTSAGCMDFVAKMIKRTNEVAGMYVACGPKKTIKTGPDLDECVKDAIRAQGQTPVVAGETSSTGAITINKPPMSQCQPIRVRATEIHEASHATTVAHLTKVHGAGTPAFDKAYNDPQPWLADELRARAVETQFLRKVLAALGELSKAVK